jgi:hypothetical protein
LRRTGHYDGPVSGDFDGATRRALRALVGSENLESAGTARATRSTAWSSITF